MVKATKSAVLADQHHRYHEGLTNVQPQPGGLKNHEIVVDIIGIYLDVSTAAIAISVDGMTPPQDQPLLPVAWEPGETDSKARQRQVARVTTSTKPTVPFHNFATFLTNATEA